MQTVMDFTGNEKIENTKFIFVDTETTGLNPRSARICEIAAVTSVGFEEIRPYSQLINPEQLIPAEVSVIHGITDDMVRDAPSFRDIAHEVLDMFEDAVLVGHNVRFDISFISAELGRAGLRMPRVRAADTLAMAKKSGKFKSNRLGAIVEALHLPAGRWHRALADVQMTRQVFRYLVQERMNREELLLKDILCTTGEK